MNMRKIFPGNFLAGLVLSWMLIGMSAWAGAMTLDAGYSHTCAMLDNGTVQCWGRNNYGQVGSGSSTSQIKVPVQVSGISNAKGISAGEWHTCALLASGTVQCWGWNSSGQLGNGDTTNSTTPVTVAGLSDIATAISAGPSHTCVLLRTSQVQCWGNNYSGQLGNDSTSNSTAPVMVSGLSDVKAISAGYARTCAVLNSGEIKCWGQNSMGQLGTGYTLNSSIPLPVSGIVNASGVSTSSQYHTCATLITGFVQCWGDNSFGQLGTGNTTRSLTPVTVSGVSNAMTVTAEEYHTCAALSNGGVQCWGAGDSGQLGDGRATSSSTPVTVSGFSAQASGDADVVFDWVEKTYPQYFSPAGRTSESLQGFWLRYYPNSMSYLGVYTGGTQRLYYYGPASNNQLLDLGLLSDWLAQVR